MKMLPVMLFLLFGAVAAEAQRGWRTVGSTTVSRGTDRDTIRVRGNMRDRQIRVCALNRSIQFVRLTVRFQNGGVQPLPVRRVLNAGTCTPVQDLRGRRRNVSSVSMVYRRFGPGRPPVVRVQTR